MIAAYGFSAEGMTLDGKRLEDIYRVELELKPDRCVIPWETIDQRDQYFAGAYPFNAELLPEVEPDVLLRDPKKAPQRELQALLGVIREQYGKSFIRPVRPSKGTLASYGIRSLAENTIRALLRLVFSWSIMSLCIRFRLISPDYPSGDAAADGRCGARPRPAAETEGGYRGRSP